MARMNWKPLEQMTPFARRILHYMEAQWPHLTIPDLAEKTGISASTIYDWFNKDGIPRSATIQAIAKGTGIPLDELYEAAGIPSPVQSELEELLQEIKGKRNLPSDVRSKLASTIREAQASYSVGANPQDRESAYVAPVNESAKHQR